MEIQPHQENTTEYILSETMQDCICGSYQV